MRPPMGNSRTPAIIAGALLVAAVVAFFVLRDSDSDDDSSTPAATTTSTAQAADANGQGGGGGAADDKPADGGGSGAGEVATIVIENGQPKGGVAELSFTEGEDIRFRVESDVDEEVHFHGYDVAEDVTAGGSVEFDVPTTLTGVFEVELEHSVVPIAEITVNPA